MTELKDRCECPDQGAHWERDGHGYCRARWTERIPVEDVTLHLCLECAQGHEPDHPTPEEEAYPCQEGSADGLF